MTCEWDPRLPAGDPGCVPDLALSAICFDLDHRGVIERYWHRLTNAEDRTVTVTWADGSADLPARGSRIVASAADVITLSVDGAPVVTTPTPSDEFSRQTVRVSKIVSGPERADGGAAPVYTIQISRLVGATYLPEGDTYQLTGGEIIAVPLPSTFNPEGVNYRIDEVDAGGAHANSVTPDSFLLRGHKNETIDVVIENTFASISLEKTASAGTVEPGDELNYTLVATNTGELALDPVTIVDRLPVEVIYEDGDFVIDGGAPADACFLDEAARPQLIRCVLTGTLEPGPRRRPSSSGSRSTPTCPAPTRFSTMR